MVSNLARRCDDLHAEDPMIKLWLFFFFKKKKAAETETNGRCQPISSLHMYTVMLKQPYGGLGKRTRKWSSTILFYFVPSAVNCVLVSEQNKVTSDVWFCD